MRRNSIGFEFMFRNLFTYQIILFKIHLVGCLGEMTDMCLSLCMLFKEPCY